MTRSPLLPFAVAVLGIASFSAMDAVMKALMLQIGTYNALLWRTFASALIAGAIYLPARGVWPGRAAVRVHLLRGTVTAVMTVGFFWGLARVPMAQAVALAFIAPLLALFGARWVLKEAVPRRAVIASVIALGGVMTILLGQAQVAPSPERFRGTLAILFSATCYAYNIILMRQQALVSPPREVAAFQALIVAAILALGAPFLGHLPPAPAVPLIALGGMLTTGSLLLLAWAYARAPAYRLAPSEYTGFLWASLWGLVIFGEAIAGYTLAGAFLIVLGCTIAARQQRTPPIESAL